MNFNGANSDFKIYYLPCRYFKKNNDKVILIKKKFTVASLDKTMYKA